MSDKRKRPVTGNLITSGLRSGFLEVGTSPTTPLEFRVLSPTGLISSEMGGNMKTGLGIVAALENPGENIPAKKSSFRCRNPNGNKLNQVSIFDISPANSSDDDNYTCIAPEFLSSCRLCNKKLHGKDIYMYRGDKAFCSPECRSKQVGMDERREKHCSSQASSSSSSIATRSHVLATGIFVI